MSFPFLPNTNTLTFTVTDTGGAVRRLALLVRQYPYGLGIFIELNLLQEDVPGSWAYVGNLPPATATLDRNAGLLWQIDPVFEAVYKAPNKPEFTGYGVDIFNHEQFGMILDWIAKVNGIIHRVFFGTTPPAPPSGGWPVATWQDGSVLLQGFIPAHLRWDVPTKTIIVV